MAPFSQFSEPPGNSGRFRECLIGSLTAVPNVLDRTIETSICAATEYIWADGPNQLQFGATVDFADKCDLMSMISGNVKDAAGLVLPGVSVSVQNHPEFGSTVTLDDGTFKLVVTGEGKHTLQFEKPDYLTSYRSVDSVAGGYSSASSVASIDT